MIKRIALASLVACLLLSGAGCGGGGSSSDSSATRGGIAFSVTWPKPKGRYLGNNAGYVRVTVVANDVGGTSPVPNLEFTNSGTFTTERKSTIPLVAGSYSLTASSFVNSSSTVPIAVKTIDVNVTVGDPVPKTITLEATLNNLVAEVSDAAVPLAGFATETRVFLAATSGSTTRTTTQVQTPLQLLPTDRYKLTVTPKNSDDTAIALYDDGGLTVESETTARDTVEHDDETPLDPATTFDPTLTSHVYKLKVAAPTNTTTKVFIKHTDRFGASDSTRTYELPIRVVP